MGTLAELTRNEYIRLLQAAKSLEKERAYFLLKAFCGIGMRVGEVEQFTVEMLKNGSGILESKGTKRLVTVPNAIKKEFEDYIARNGIYRGPIFITRNGTPIDRVNIVSELKSICETARVSEEKVSPSSLWKLHRSTLSSIEKDMAMLAWMRYEQSLAEEQIFAGWDAE